MKNFHRKRVTVLTTTTLYKIVQSELYALGHDHEIVDKEGNLVFFDNDFQVMSKIMSYDNDIETIVDRLFNHMKLNNTIHDQHFKKTFFFRFINREINRQTVESFMLELTATFLTNMNYINIVYEDLEKYLNQWSTTDQTNKQLSKEISQQINQQVASQIDERLNSENSTQDNTQNTNQTVTGNTTSDNRQASSDLPQNRVNLDVNNTVMATANNNDISRNKQTNSQDTDGTTTNNTTGTNTGESNGRTESDSNSQTDGTSDSESTGETSSISKSYRMEELFKSSNLIEGIMNTFDRKCFMQF